MNKTDQAMEAEIKKLLDSQQLAVLSTQRNGQPYASLMAFAYTGDLQEILVATGRSTRKHLNIMAESRVSLLVDNRTNSAEDFHQAVALTVIGKAQEIAAAKRGTYEELYLKRHPYLKKFLESPSIAFIKIEVHHYLLVSRFQNVMEYHLRNEMDILP